MARYYVEELNEFAALRALHPDRLLIRRSSGVGNGPTPVRWWEARWAAGAD